MANIVQGEHDWMYRIPGAGVPNPGMGFPSPPPIKDPTLLQKILGGLTGTPANAGAVDPAIQTAARQQALMALSAQLLAGSGPSQTKQSLGSVLGPALLAGQQAHQQGIDSALQTQLLMSQIQRSKQKPRSKPTAVMGPDGKPIFVSEEEAIGQQPFMKAGSQFGAYQPGDYTPASWAKFQKSGNPADLERYITPRQEYSPSFQNVNRTLPDGSTEQGTFDTRTGAYNWSGQIVPAGTKARTDAQGREIGKITGAREGKAPTAYAAFETGVKSLEQAMSGTVTGPVAGRIPAVTAGQQIAEGAQATMAPILKQLFRDSGEGTFTDSDQHLLMQMVPTRTDHPEARKAKIAMIDSIVRAKLGIGADGAVPGAQPAGAPKRVRVDAEGNVIGN